MRLDAHFLRQARSHYARYSSEVNRTAFARDGDARAARAKMEADVAETLREAYRTQWSLPQQARTLANVPNYTMRSAADVAPHCGSRLCTADPWFVGAALRVCREYQRPLWDPDCTLRRAEGERPSVPGIGHSRSGFDDDGAVNDPTIDSRAPPRGRRWRRAVESCEAFHFERFGGVGVFFTDLRGNRLGVDGFARPDNPLVSERQWRALEAALRSQNMSTLVCSELPSCTSPRRAAQAARPVERRLRRRGRATSGS